LESGVGSFGKVRVRKFWKLEVGVRHFTFDSATLDNSNNITRTYEITE